MHRETIEKLLYYHEQQTQTEQKRRFRYALNEVLVSSFSNDSVLDRTKVNRLIEVFTELRRWHCLCAGAAHATRLMKYYVPFEHKFNPEEFDYEHVHEEIHNRWAEAAQDVILWLQRRPARTTSKPRFR